MTPIRLSHIWYRRLYVAIFVVSVAYFLLYALHTFNVLTIPEALRVDLIPAIASLVAAILAATLWVLIEKVTNFWAPIITYGVLAITTAWLAQSTGGIHSDFLAIWAIIVFAAPIFGAYGWIPILVMVGSYIAGDYLAHNGLDSETILLLISSTAVPLAAGLVLWRNTPDADDTSTRNVKNLANQLSEVAMKSEIVINAIGDGVITVDGKGIIQLINPAAQTILGWGKQDALMLNYKSILKLTDLNGKDIDDIYDPVQQVLNTNQQARGNKLLAITNSGKKISVAVVASPIGDPGSGAIAVFRDVTDERAEEREQAEFISTASHEMRTPVASIEGYLGLALNPNTATIDNKARDFIQKAHEAAQHLGRLFQDLLDVSKSEDGRMTNTPRVVDLVPFTADIVQGLMQKATDKGLRLTFVPGEGNGTERGIKKVMPMFYVNLDNDHIREVLDNLVENAIKYTPEGEVRVDINGTEDNVVISIKDSGLGIPTEDIPHLFQKFYRVNNADRQSIGGTGLGLYLCRRLIEAMQGRLWVESVFQEGSTFFVELPRLGSQEAEVLKTQQEREAAAKAALQPAVEAAPVLETSMAAPIVPSVPTPAPAPAAAPTPAPAPARPLAMPSAHIPVTFADTSAAPAAPAATPTVQAPLPASTLPQPTKPPVAQPVTATPAAAPTAAPATATTTPIAVTTAPAAPQANQPSMAQLMQQVGPPKPENPFTAPTTAQPQPTAQQAPAAAAVQVSQPATPAPAPAPAVAAPQGVPPQAPTGAKPATYVPRGELLSRDQINERVRQLEALAQQQRSAGAAPPR